MSMDTAAASAWVISLEDLKKICPDEVLAIEKLLDKLEATWQTVAMYVQNENWEGDKDNLDDLLDDLTNSFLQKTKLDLVILYYDEENGSRYDEITHTDGCVFEVIGMTQLTNAGKELQKQINVSFEMWTTFG